MNLTRLTDIHLNFLRPLAREAFLDMLAGTEADVFVITGDIGEAALARFRHVVVAAHGPPFRESCWHDGQVSNDDWLLFFTCKAVGDVLAEALAAAPDRMMTVLRGHTHGGGEAQLLPNLRVLTGGAWYGNPVVQRVLEVG